MLQLKLIRKNERIGRIKMITCYEETIKYQKNYEFIPIVKEIYADVITPIMLLRKLAAIDKQYYLLESVEGGEQWGRYSFLGFQPLLSISCKSGKVIIKNDEISSETEENPKEALRNILKKYKAPKIEGLPPFVGGFVGYFSYEMIQYAEPKLKIKQNQEKDFDLMLFDKVIVYDHLRQKIYVVVNAKLKEKEQGYQKAKLEIDKIIHFICDTEQLIEKKEKKAEIKEILFTCNTSEEEYCEMVNKTKQYIKEGDIFQAVLSRKFEAEYNGSLLSAYRVLRTTNPSPYMYFIQNEELQIAGASPETMVKLVDEELTTFPVAGTRKRGKNLKEDEALEKELMQDEKELAEHNMLVDLARNDIGKIAEYGSVKLTEYLKVHRFSKVMHIASTVCGRIKKEKDNCDAIEALLPAGTLSGAPKFRACEIIDELEKESRGIYGGAIGYLDFTGNLDVCIAIRTAVKKKNKVFVQAGAGIVADSIPQKEYEECQNKAGAVIEAIKKAEELDFI